MARISDHIVGSMLGKEAPPQRDTEQNSAGAHGHSELHEHGDGTYHTVGKDGQQEDHPHLGHALAHLANQHEPEGKHSVIHHEEGGTHVSHHVGADGAVQGPHDHENTEALKAHMDQFLSEEEHEGEGEYGGAPKPKPLFED